jgi:uncharacterized protein (TIGR02996 family)
MHDESGFLNAIRQNPADDVARLVFADWLDERDAPAGRTKSDFIRLELKMAAAPEKRFNRVRWVKKLEQLAARRLAVVSHPKLEACSVSFHFACPQRWELLTVTEDERHCSACSRPVHFCHTIEEARAHAACGNCVAVSPALPRKPDDLVSPPMFVTAGMPALLSDPIETPGAQPSAQPDAQPEPLKPQWVPTAPQGKAPRRARRSARPHNIQREPCEDELGAVTRHQTRGPVSAARPGPSVRPRAPAAARAIASARPAAAPPAPRPPSASPSRRGRSLRRASGLR